MNKKCFTLIELIVVIAIIAILAAIIAPNAFKAIEKAKVSAFVGDMKALKSGLYALYADTGMFPDHYESIDHSMITGGAGWAGTAGWDGPYLEGAIQNYWGGESMANIAFQNSCGDPNKDWDGDSGCELFYCYQPAPPIGAQQKIDQAIDGGDGPAEGWIRTDLRGNHNAWENGCFWPLFADQ